MDSMSQNLLREAENTLSQARLCSDKYVLKTLYTGMENIHRRFNDIYDGLERSGKYEDMNACTDVQSLVGQMKGEVQSILANSYD